MRCQPWKRWWWWCTTRRVNKKGSTSKFSGNSRRTLTVEMRRRSSFFFLLKMTKGENKKWAWFHSKKDLLHLVERHPWRWLSFLSLNSNHSWRVSIVCKSWMMLRLLLCLECLEGCSFYAVDDRIFLHLLFGRQSHFLPVYCFVMLFLLMFFFCLWSIFSRCESWSVSELHVV